MPVKLEDRPLETVKEEVIDILVHNYSHGFISSEAFERRLDNVIETQSHQVMMDQVEDLEATIDESVKKYKESQFSVNYTHDETPESDSLINILGSSDRSGVWNVAREIKVFSLLGSANIDFTDARFSSPHVTIKVISILSSNEVYVPESVNVVSKAFCLLGSTTNKAASVASHQAPTITVEGVVLLSDLTIKIKTSVKEKFVAFANQMKEMFSSNSKY